MTGIVAFSAYVPRYRLSRKTISSATGWLGQAGRVGGEKAIASYDEDSITMAVTASLNCLSEIDRHKVDGLYFASTTAPYRERGSADIIGTALDLGANIRTADFAGSLRSGTNALLAAEEAVRAGGAGNILVCSADCRLGKAGSNAEMLFGDGGAAYIIGSENVLVTVEGSYCLSYDFPDHWRSEYDRYDRVLEDRFIRDEGYSRFIPEALNGLMKKYGLQVKDVTKVVYPSLYPRETNKINKNIGFTEEQVQSSLLEAMGDAGTASPLLMLVGALDEAKPGDNILLTSYGNGCTVLWLRVTQQIEKHRRITLKAYLNSRQELDSYERYAAFRGILPMDMGMRGELGTTYLPVTWRERNFILGLVGSKCRRCGTPQLPPQRICANPDCGVVDEMEPYRFSDKKATLFSYTEDNLAFSIHRPQIYGMVDFDGGGRYIFDITDCEAGTLQVGIPMEVTFRRKYYDEARGIHGYFWKAMPVRIAQGDYNG